MGTSNSERVGFASGSVRPPAAMNMGPHVLASRVCGRCSALWAGCKGSGRGAAAIRMHLPDRLDQSADCLPGFAAAPMADATPERLPPGYSERCAPPSATEWLSRVVGSRSIPQARRGPGCWSARCASQTLFFAVPKRLLA